MKISDVCLVITGCMQPSADVPMLAVRDYNERKKQYIDSISFFVEKTNIKKIIYCDSSNAPVDEQLLNLANNFSKELEWLSFQGNSDKVICCGKGYGEGEIIKYVLAKSQLIKTCTSFVKVTGRLKILNFNWLLRLVSDKYSYLYYLNGAKRVDTRCYVAKIEDYKEYMIDAHEAVNDTKGFYLEHAFYQASLGKEKDFRMMPIALDYSGQSGSMGTTYHNSKLYIFMKSVLLFMMGLFGRKGFN